MLTIDGSIGEGGGQILRTALALVTGKPFRIEKIRAGRDKPGLLRQHLTAVNAAIQIGRAKAEGAAVGATELAFSPGKAVAGDYHFAVGTAGSTTLVLQTVLPALLTANGPSRLTLEGGTHNPFAPPFDFLQRTFLPVLNQMGPQVTATLERPGFYPAGGGRFNVVIQPCERLKPIELLERGEIRRRLAKALVAGLPKEIGLRELSTLQKRISWGPECFEVEVKPDAFGPGNFLMVEIESSALTEVVTGFGERGISAETVAERVSREVRRYLAAGVPVGEHLADQLLLPLALAGRGCFKTFSLSRHAKTNIEIIRTFLEIPVVVEQVDDEGWLVQVGGRE